MEKAFKEMMKDLMELETDGDLAENLKDVWELQDRLKEIERGIIKGDVVSLEMTVEINVGKLKGELKKQWYF